MRTRAFARARAGFGRAALAFARADEFRLLKGDEALSNYQYTPEGRPEPFLHLNFYKRCGVRPFSNGGEMARFGGKFFAVKVDCLDDASDEELASAPIHHADGRNNDWEREATETSYL